MADHYSKFPFEEIRQANGDYFPTWQAAKDAGHEDNQIWSVVESNGSYSYGPPHHFVNVIGFIATAETHDFETYYHDENTEEANLQEALDLAQTEFIQSPNNVTAAGYLTAAMDAEAEGIINDEEFLDHLVAIRDWLTP